VIHPRIQDEVTVTVIATGLKDSGSRAAPAARRASALDPPQATRGAVEPPPRYVEPRPAPAPGEWERRPRSAPAQNDDDDWDTPSYLRRPRQ
jgi:hypothetical protein